LHVVTPKLEVRLLSEIISTALPALNETQICAAGFVAVKCEGNYFKRIITTSGHVIGMV